MSRYIPETSMPYRLPQPADPPLRPEHFMALPVALWQGLTPEQRQWQQAVYGAALAQAQAAARPSLPERDLLAVWN